jgi:flagellar FliL protein
VKCDNSGKILIVIIIGVLVIALLAGIGVFVLRPSGTKDKKDKHKEEPTSTIELGEFVVNLADIGQVRYLKTNLVLEVTGRLPDAGGGHSEGGSSNAELRDAVIGVLSSKRFVDLVKPGSKELLKKDIIKAVNRRMDEAKVVAVYFNEFAMQ